MTEHATSTSERLSDDERPRRPRPKSLVVVLWVVAGLLVANLVATVGGNRSRWPDVLTLSSSALAQPAPQPIAGGAGFYLMPAQFATNQWGCYVMDVDAQTLVAYVYDPAKPGMLRLAASRNFASDRLLRSYNTQPRPEDVEQIIRLERDTARRPESLNPTPATTPANE